MSELSSKIRRVEGGWMHWCPACNQTHFFRERVPFEQRPTWTYDQCHDHPTFYPSMDIRHPQSTDDPSDVIPAYRCHYQVISGYIHFCANSTHAYAGQVVDLPDLPSYLRDRETT